MPETREELLVRAFVSLADSLVSDFDVLEMLQTLVEQATLLFDASASGIIIGPDDRHLEVVASTSEKSHLVGLMQLRTGEGPCVEAVSTGQVVSVADMAEIDERWPGFAREAAGSGYASVHAIPLRLRGQIIGSLNLFRDREGPLNPADALAAQALADVATISVLQERTIRDSNIVRDQLRYALDSRVLIEQAKGVIAHTHGLDMDGAFRLIRERARSTSSPMLAVSAGIVEGRITLESPEASRISRPRG